MKGSFRLFQIPQRYRFSSKSQQNVDEVLSRFSCFRYHKGTDFQANHNIVPAIMQGLSLFQIPQRYRFSSKSQLSYNDRYLNLSCFRYHKGTDFQANHNTSVFITISIAVVLDTTKVQIFKQITTSYRFACYVCRCFRYHKGTDFQANHNRLLKMIT